ncbi:bifunctional methionine sulfoxide reductase B/A protein [Lentisphaera marina]|uniref:bifunctional methionine sulfoxide reductase B/A protein n=1 Tax=Lentisphaera marina TaxID=1111041 RepID=UPI002365233B|nr:bifunctional methionine sulfoxide reductase B/A protein [Lentisphaera marina]MDD7984824.1 bifunctional methionine sulfoxide reductase B/A protein [Lentisphaera marina]
MKYLILLSLLFFSCTDTVKQTHLKYNELTSAEAEILLHKGTEKPFSGEYDKHYEEGDYACRQCNTLLFSSSAKFDSNTGWPSFDDNFSGAIEIRDDFSREEIVCSTCKGHLGHVFRGEGFTPKDTRHCVNSLAIKFVAKSHIKKAIFASGCFWGTDYWLRSVQGVLDTKSGYIGGSEKNPSYEDVCTGTTGHYEAVEITYDTNLVDYETLARMYFNTHNPEQANGQGNDIGSQYLPAIFYLDEKQKSIAESLLNNLRAKGLKPATELIPASHFWPAEEYHQDYYLKNGKKPYCHFYRPLFDEE